MFGYIVVNQSEMKFREYDVYRSYYCGLCQSLKERYGVLGQLSLNYDMTFILMLLTGLYEPKEQEDQCRCVAHPLEKHATRRNLFTDYVADMYGEKVKNIALAMQNFADAEKQGNADIDTMAGLFGKVMAQIVSCREDEWKDNLERLGFFLGKFIYLLDAYEDVEQDIKKGTYNPLKKRYAEPGFEEECRQILTMMMSECCKEFEQLPILQNVDILRNILYSGVWCRYEIVRKKREKNNAKEVTENEL